MTKPVKKKANEHWLDVGMNVLFNHQVGVIKYIGNVKFAEGIWLGKVYQSVLVSRP